MLGRAELCWELSKLPLVGEDGVTVLGGTTAAIQGGSGVELMLAPVAEALRVYSGLVREKQERAYDPWADQTHAGGGLLAALALLADE